MTKKKKRPSRLAMGLIETAKGMHRIGLPDLPAYEKMILHHLGRKDGVKLASITPRKYGPCV